MNHSLVYGIAIAGLCMWGYASQPAVLSWFERQQPPGSRPVRPTWMSVGLILGMLGGELILLGQAIQLLAG